MNRIESEVDGYITTYNNKKFYFDYPHVDMIDLNDIAHSLSMMCRYNGHVYKHYSIAQHCVLASRLVPKRLALAALMHDAAEAYMGDMVSPLKKRIPKFKEIESRIEKIIEQKFNFYVSEEDKKLIKKVDDILYVTEIRDLKGFKSESKSDIIPMNKKIHPWKQNQAYWSFINRYRKIESEQSKVCSNIR